MYLLVTIDTEEDMPQWRPEAVPHLNNIIALLDLHEKMTILETRSTYLVNGPVIDDDSSCNIIRRLTRDDKCEVGMHLNSHLENRRFKPYVCAFQEGAQSKNIYQQHGMIIL